MPPPYNATNLLIKPTYDVAFYGEDLHLPLGLAPLALAGITWSGIDELKTVDADMENYSRIISDVDTLGILNEGDGVAFDHTYNWLSDMSAFVYKFNLTLAVGLSVTAWTSGDHSIDSVRIRITERLQDGTLVKPIADLTKSTGMTALGAVGDAVAIVTFEGNTPFKVSQGNIVRLQITLGRTDTLVATSFEGIMPLFFFQEGNLTKQMVESTLNLHLHPALDHAFDVFRDQSFQEGLDYNGITEQGISRQAESINAPLPNGSNGDGRFLGDVKDLPHAHFPHSRPVNFEAIQ